MIRTILLFPFMAFWAFSAMAHAPYYTQVGTFQTESGAEFSIKLLHGDGILGSDPVRAIVVNADGQVHAVSPLAGQLFLLCDGSVSGCNVYDGATREVHELNLADWWAGGMTVEESSKPSLHPFDMGEDYGFVQRQATIGEILKYELLKICAYPTFALFALIWWSVIVALLVPMVWKLIAVRGKILPMSFLGVSVVVARLAIAGLLLLLTLFVFAWDPISIPAVLLYVSAAISLNLTWLGVIKRKTPD
ncbi:MAG: hypothetical protein ACPGUX_06135 [Halocynthiibacter sp.]